MNVEWRNVGCITIPKETTEEDLAVCLFDVLQDITRDSHRRACELLGHPDQGYGLCYCRIFPRHD